MNLLRGKKVLELTVVTTDKGTAFAELVDEIGATATVFIGDDVTDENAFEALGPRDLTVKVGAGPTTADVRIAGPSRVADLLTILASARHPERVLPSLSNSDVTRRLPGTPRCRPPPRGQPASNVQRHVRDRPGRAGSTTAAGPDQRADRLGDVPDVDVHPADHPAAGGPEHDELPAGPVAAVDHRVGTVGHAGELHPEVVLVGEEERQVIVGDRLPQHGFRRGRPGGIGVVPVLDPDLPAAATDSATFATSPAAQMCGSEVLQGSRR